MRMQGKLGVRWLDETDCVGAWESDAMAAVVLPTANTLPQLRDMAAAGGGGRLLLVVNPQWQMDGQIVSDFGCVNFQHIMCCNHVYQSLKCLANNWCQQDGLTGTLKAYLQAQDSHRTAAHKVPHPNSVQPC